MGEVYRAHDTKLRRDVALKILPEAFAADPDRLARFEREAQALASLNHPHIAQIYGLEDTGAVRALVMELVEGDALADRIAQAPAARATSASGSRGARASGSGAARAVSDGGLPLDEVLNIARQICDALEAAHEAGVVHRDLKPANIKLKADGIVKVLDFGLAKLAEPSGTGRSGGSGGLEGLSQSPTLTSPAGMTGAGMLLGTAAYMSPEQARGKTVDKRADIWAFGVVLYEMLTGRRAFEGEVISLTLAEVMKGEPDWSALPATLPLGVLAVLGRCLQKDPKQRLRDIGDVRLVLDGAFERATAQAVATAAPLARSTWSRALPWVAAVLLSAAAGFAAWVLRPGLAAPVSRFEIVLPDLAVPASGRAFALSPDGRSLVYVAETEGRTLLMRREMAQLAAVPVSGTDGATAPFFSPDGAWIGFIGERRSAIRKVPAEGGAAFTVWDSMSGLGMTPTWSADGTIIFGTGTGLWRVPATGGVAEQLTKTERPVGGVEALPDGRAVLFPISAPGNAEGSIEVLELASGERRVLTQGTYPRYSPSGHLLFSRVDGSLWAASFDASKLVLSGEAMPLSQAVFGNTLSSARQVSLAASTLVYLSGGPAPTSGELVWVQRDGTAKPANLEPGEYSYPRLSPDGKRVAVGLGGDIWTLDLERSTRTRLTFGDRGRGLAAMTAWAPDGQRVTFLRGRGASLSEGSTIAWTKVDGSERAPQILIRSEGLVNPSSWSRNGTLAFQVRMGPQNRDLWVHRPNESPSDKQFLATPAEERAPTFSPDGLWIAYVSNESSRDEVYVAPYPGPGERHTVSNGGGTEPVWSREGNELFYRNGDAMMTVAVRKDAGLSFGQPHRLFSGPFVRDASQASAFPFYDVAADGSFLMIQSAPASNTRLIIVQNWLEELKRLVPLR